MSGKLFIQRRVRETLSTGWTSVKSHWDENHEVPIHTHQYVDCLLGLQHLLGKLPNGRKIGGVQVTHHHLAAAVTFRLQLTCAVTEVPAGDDNSGTASEQVTSSLLSNSW
ncbi:hypothetical protein E2C01_024115 [Portunus trituberculatus]|uniref:Uncharacterized protein n=1 Tax=Portunus trituberculatus TaxID=210409 RepID=A0A5B7ECA9_PORTR|nr:hypothetical protein [Portunus trituberculatus]